MSIIPNQTSSVNQITRSELKPKFNPYTMLEHQKKTYPTETKLLSISLLLTGIFAAIGALYRWGDGSLFNAPPGTDLTIYITDFLVAAPLSIATAIGYQKMKKWAFFSGLLSVGVFIYGSIIVYASVFQNGIPYPLKLIIPPIFGIGLSLWILFWSWRNIERFL